MVIGIDCDDVCCNFQKRFVAVLNELYGRPALDTHPIDWNWSNCQASVEEMKAAWKYSEGIPYFWANLEPLPEFDTETIELLRRAVLRHDVYFITNRYATPGSSPMKQTKYWFSMNAGIDAPNVIIAKEKGPVATMLQLDVFIDDRPKNCTDVKQARPQCKVYLANSSHNQPYNARWCESNGVEGRVADLKEFLKLILEAN